MSAKLVSMVQQLTEERDALRAELEALKAAVAELESHPADDVRVMTTRRREPKE